MAKQEKQSYLLDHLHPKDDNDKLISISDSSSEQLYNLLEKYNEKSVKGEDLRNKVQEKKFARAQNLQGIVNNTLKDLHGAHSDNEQLPSSYDLSDHKDGDKHAKAILDGLVEEFYKQNFGEHSAKASKDNVHGKNYMLRAFNDHLARVSGGRWSYTAMLNDLTTKTNHANSKDFQQQVQSLHHVEEEHHIEQAEDFLRSDRRHEGYVVKKANDLYKAHDVQLKEGVKQEHAFGALEHALQGAEHIQKYSNKKMFVPYEKKAA